jgi:hypothetical protein
LHQIPQGRTVLICHEQEPLNRFGLARWLASFTELAVIVVIREPPARLRRRIQREIERVGWLRFLDVLAFRIYSRFALAPRDSRWTAERLSKLEASYPPVPSGTRILTVGSPNDPEVETVLREAQPDIILARCKSILSERIFGIARVGTFVMHPGICPEYRNAHGCFWALASRDLEKVGMTLLKVDRGVDTGNIYGYYTYPYDEAAETHNMIQSRVVLDNLDALEQRFKEILANRATPIDTSGRKSQAWGQPWLTAYWRWKSSARRESRSCAR